MKFVLAPIADFTDPPFRTMCFRGGADGAYTEMVSAAALRHGHEATRFLLEKNAGEGPVACQIFGSDELDVAFAARAVDAVGGRFCALNLNAGCPMKKIVRTGAGASLVSKPEKVEKLLRAMKENTSLPVTLKTRLGTHSGETTVFELAGAAEAAGAAEIAVHARFVSEMHSGAPHLDILRDLVSRTRLPVTGNGGVADRRSAADMAATGVDGVMIARAALARPHVFAEIKAALSGAAAPPEKSPKELFSEHLALVLEYADSLAAAFPHARPLPRGKLAVLKTRTHLFRYFSGVPGAAAVRKRLMSADTTDEIFDIISTI